MAFFGFRELARRCLYASNTGPAFMARQVLFFYGYPFKKVKEAPLSE
jgi:hypothetical protein